MPRHRVEIVATGDESEIANAAKACVKRISKQGNTVESATVGTHEKGIKNSVSHIAQADGDDSSE